ncbi:MAG: ABC transporter permease [Candidatus Hodarchaeales archaeon]|jgi:iron(III) transport system permease protein
MENIRIPPRVTLTKATISLILLLGGGYFIIRPIIEIFITAGEANVLEVLTSARLLQRALPNTLILATGGTLLAAIIGVSLALIMGRTDVPLKGVLEIAILTPFFMSSLITTLAWVYLASPKFGTLNLLLKNVLGINVTINIFSFSGAILILGCCYAPYVYLFTIGSMQNMDASLEESALSSGASYFYTIFRITIPLSSPAILSAMILTFTLMCSIFTLPAILLMTKQKLVLSTEVWRAMSYELSPDPGRAAIYGIILIIIVTAGFSIRSLLLRRKAFTTVSGKMRPTEYSLGKFRYVAFIICVSYFLIAMLLPYSSLIIQSFQRNLFSGFSLDNLSVINYIDVLQIEFVRKGIINTLLIAVISATAGTFLAFLYAFSTDLLEVPGKNLLKYIAIIPVGIPPIILSLGLLRAWIGTPLYGTVWVLLLAYMIRIFPYSTSICSSGLGQIGRELSEVSQSCGASLMRTLRCIIIPLNKGSLVSSWFLLFITVVREFGEVIFLYRYRTMVLPGAIFELWVDGRWQLLSAASVIQTLLTITIIATLLKTMGRKAIYMGR